MSLNYLIDPNMQFQDRNGVNNVAGFLRVYYEGTDDRATTYKDFIGTLNPADIPLDNDGRAVVIADSEKEYRVEVYSASGAMLWTQHPVFPQGGGGSEYDGDVSDATATFTKDEGDTSEIASGSTLKVLFTKISKFFASLKRVAFTGSYKDLSDTNVVFIERLTAEYSEITELLRNDRVIMTTDGFIYCGYGDDKYYFIRFKISGSYGAMFEMSSVDTDNHWVTGSSGKLLDSDFWRLAFARGDTLNIALNSYNQPYLTQCPLYQTTKDASSFTEGTFVATVPNNKLTFITNLLVPNLEIRAYLECYDVPSEHVANFAVEVTPTVDCTVTVKTSKNSYATPHWITLYRASGVSNVMRAGNKYQITCIGTCWTIAKFELPS